MTAAGVQKPTMNALETKIAGAQTTTPAATSGEVAPATIGAPPTQPAQPADHLVDAGATSRTAMMVNPGEGERAAAADINAMANTPDTLASTSETKTSVSIGDMPVSAKLATTADTTVPPGTMDSANKLAVEGQTALVVTTVEPAGARPAPLSPEVRDVDAAPSIQVATAPPPPPAAPETSVRSVGEGASGGASADDTGLASPATATDGLGYRPQSYGAATSGVRVVLRARAESWVQVQGANNELLLTRILRVGDSYYAPNRADLVLMTGNAGAIEVIVDGVELGPLGPIGLVRRNILLNADHLRLQLQPPGRSSR
jgi:cytoskeleton protein RodZ